MNFSSVVIKIASLFRRATTAGARGACRAGSVPLRAMSRARRRWWPEIAFRVHQYIGSTRCIGYPGSRLEFAYVAKVARWELFDLRPAMRLLCHLDLRSGRPPAV